MVALNRKQEGQQAEADVPPSGAVARALRLRRGLTLDRLAELSGLSKGHLSRFERGEKSLSIASLMRLASSLDTSVSRLLGEHVDDDLLHLVRAQERKMHDVPAADGAYGFAVLSRAATKGSPTVFVVDIPARSRRTGDAYHSGEEIVFVIEGQIEVVLTDRTIVLREGDYLQFPGHLRHVVRGRAEHSRVLIAIFG